MPLLLLLQELQGKGDGGWKNNNCLRRFLPDQKSSNAWKMRVFCFDVVLFCFSRATSSCLLADTIWSRAFTNAFIAGIVSFANSVLVLHRNNCTASLQAWGNRSGLPREMTMVLVFVSSIIAGWPGDSASTIYIDPLTLQFWCSFLPKTSLGETW